MPSSSQIRNALAYMAVTVLVLVFLNIYSADERVQLVEAAVFRLRLARSDVQGKMLVRAG